MALGPGTHPHKANDDNGVATIAILHIDSYRRKIPHNNVVVRMAMQVIRKPFTKTRVKVWSPVIKLFYLGPARLGNQYRHLHVVPEIVEPTHSNTFYSFISSFRTKRNHLPKGIIISHGTEPPLNIENSPQSEHDPSTTAETSLQSKETMIATVHYMPAKNREAQMNRHKAVESRNQQCSTNDWQIGSQYLWVVLKKAW